jgi:hypothetical protein
MKERMWRNGECKETGGGEKRMEKVMRRESKNLTYSSYIQLLCTVANIQLFLLGPAHYTVHKHTSQAFTLSASLNLYAHARYC